MLDLLELRVNEVLDWVSLFGSAFSSGFWLLGLKILHVMENIGFQRCQFVVTQFP